MLKRLSVIYLVFATLFLFSNQPAYSDDLEDQLQNTNQELQNAETEKNSTQTEIERLEQLKNQYQSTLSSLQNSYTYTNNKIVVTQQSLDEKETEIKQTETELEEFSEELDNKQKRIGLTIRDLYINQSSSNISTLFETDESRQSTKMILYNSAVVQNLRDLIIDLNQQIHKVEEIKDILVQIQEQLVTDRDYLVTQQHSLQNQISSTQSQIDSAHNQQQNLDQVLIGINEKIDQLSQRQKEILAAKAAAALASTSVGNTETNPALIEKGPPQDGNVYFSFWTYGYPHRVGMNQYGAFGRAKAGQGAEEILNTYYSNVTIVDWDMPENITLTDGRTIPFEDDYLMGIGEMPSCWGAPDRGGLEALKAQAIAARTYALSYTNNAQSAICTDQNCQVYVGSSKVTGTCGEYWQQAVEETRGRVIVYNDEPITAWYASTAGGFTLSSAEVWGGAHAYATGIADVDANGNAYDGPQHGNSPWYHKSWGNEPWLSFDQVTDLLNAALLPDSYNNQLDSLSSQEIRNTLASENIDFIDRIDAIEIIDQNGNPGAGTAQVAYVRGYYQDSSKTAEVSGARFKFIYNLRSPGTNALWTTRFDILTAAEM